VAAPQIPPVTAQMFKIRIQNNIITCLYRHYFMAKASTREFEVYVELQSVAAAANQTLDMTDYVDIADNQAFEVHELDIVLDVDQAFPAGNVEGLFQLADSNITAFVSHADRTSLYVARKTYDGAALGMYHQESFSSLTPLIVSKTLWCRNSSSTALNYTLRIKGRIVTPSAKDYMALVLTQTGNVA